MRRGEGFRRARDREGARRAAREAARWDRQAQELLSREKMAEAEQRRDYFARLGIELGAAGDMRGARMAAQEAERWDREGQGTRGLLIGAAAFALPALEVLRFWPKGDAPRSRSRLHSAVKLGSCPAG